MSHKDGNEVDKEIIDIKDYMTIENEYIDKNTKEVVGKRLNVCYYYVIIIRKMKLK